MKYSVIAIFFFLVLSGTSPLFANEAAKQDCSCQASPWQKAFEQSAHVVFGEVQNVKIHNDDLATGAFQAMETFKGNGSFIKQLVGSSKAEASCRQVLVSGYYIVYTNEAENVVLNPCVASRRLEDDLVQTLTQIKEYSESKEETLDIVATERGQVPKEEKGWLQSIIDWFDE